MEENLCSTLRALLGRTVRLEGQQYQVLELLKDCEALVLLPLEEGDHPIQADQYGDPRRRAPRPVTVPIWSEVRETLHPVVEEIIEQVL